MSDDWLPPEQIPTRKWPVVGERSPLPEALDPSRWRLEVSGTTRRAVLTLGEVMDLPQDTLVMDVHCVTRWSRRGMRFDGARLADLLEPLGIPGSRRFVRFEAWSERAHDTSLPLDLALEHCWLVHTADGVPLAPEHGAPLRVVTEGRYFYKSLKWVRRVELLDENRLGYWERTDGYHDGADPWPGDQRYVSGSLKPDEVERFRGAEHFDRWRGRTLRSVDLRGWRPNTRALGGLFLKNCDLREADLAGADLRGANLTLSDLRGSDLRGADLRGADLEGARLAGADLRGADLRDAALTASSFFEGTLAAQVEGVRCEGATGLLEDQEAWLRSRGLR